MLFMKLLMPFMKGKDWFLDYHNFCVNPRYIFLDKTGSGVSFIYVPEKQAGQTDEEIKAFFKQLFTEITILNDPEFQVRMFQYFASPDANHCRFVSDIATGRKNHRFKCGRKYRIAGKC